MEGKLRFGMVGGGPGAFIGDVHRMAATLDGEAELVAGAFSSDPHRSSQKGAELGLASDRVYASFGEMADAEARLPEGTRIDFVIIATPNHLHHPAAVAFLDAGFHVVCDKPMTNTVEEADDLVRRVRESGRVFVLTHNYTGYPLVKEARALVAAGRLGTIRKVVAEYPQGWLARPIEDEGQKQASWRTDPARGGVALAPGDIGSHAENLARYVTGLEIEALCADLTTVMYASQISVGEENALSLRVYGTDASLAWRQESPNELWLKTVDGPEQVLRRGNSYLSAPAQAATRLPSGHPEGFIEAFANVYRGGMAAMRGESSSLDYPTVEDGARGVTFIHRAVESGRAEGWVDLA
jgi:predicted dehydrogenase